MKNKTQIINCNACDHIGFCCREGVVVDIEEAKKISLKLPKIEFHHFRPDPTFPSGFSVSSCHGNEPCNFLDAKGLCRIHKIDFNLKPFYCKEFPMEDGKVSPMKYLCRNIKPGMKTILCEGQ
jgi:hypothetical protein